MCADQCFSLHQSDWVELSWVIIIWRFQSWFKAELASMCQFRFNHIFSKKLTCFANWEQNPKDLQVQSLPNKLHFGQHHILLQETASEYDAQLKNMLNLFGKELQIHAQIAQESCAHKTRVKLESCSTDFLDLGKEEWIKQCKKMSLVNLLDQLFAVKCMCINNFCATVTATDVVWRSWRGDGCIRKRQVARPLSQRGSIWNS